MRKERKRMIFRLCVKQALTALKSMTFMIPVQVVYQRATKPSRGVSDEFYLYK